MSRHPLRARGTEGGFVLIGVVIFVLALTIIGISLFSLSGYEAQFWQRSLDAEQAFQSAVGGIERARFVLCETGELERVGQDLPRDDVVTASAFQVRGTDSVSTGPVEWVADQPLHLRVTARVNGRECTIAASFTPQETENYYQQLLTTAQRIGVEPPVSADSTASPLPTIDFAGPVWQGIVESSADTTVWAGRLRSWSRRRIVPGGVAAPDLASYWVAHDPSRATPAGYYRSPPPADENRYTLRAGSSAPSYYRVPAGFGTSDSLYDLCDGATITVRGRGCAVWELPAGAHFLNPVFVRAGRNPPGQYRTDRCLVIVAAANPPGSGGTGLFFEGGLQSDIPIILVSDGRVNIQHINNPGFTNQAGFSTRAADIAVFAGSVVLRGPRSGALGNLDMQLGHPLRGSLNENWIPFLAVHGGLPNLQSVSGHELPLQAGTWRASTR